MVAMYLRGNKWNMSKRPRRRSSTWRIILLLVLIGAALYVNQVVVPATPPLFVPTPTPTRSPESFVNQAEELYKEGKLKPAIEAYKQAIESDPKNPSNYLSLARLQIFVSDYDSAIVNTQNALLENPNNALAYALQGWALGFQGKYSDAEIALKRSISIDPNSALAHAFYAEVLVNQGNYDLVSKAIDESKIALSLDPTILETHRARGVVLLNTGNIPQAIDEFKAAIAINKNIADLHLYLGVAYKANEQYDLAEESLLAAYALNPTDPVALTEISRSYFADGRYQQAAQFAEEAVKVLPSDPRLHGNLGIMYYKNEEFGKAITQLSLAIHGGTLNGNINVEGLPLDYDRTMEYYWYYGFSLAKSNRCGEAVPVAQALLNGVPNDETAVYNANAILQICQENQNTPAANTDNQETATPEP